MKKPTVIGGAPDQPGTATLEAPALTLPALPPNFPVVLQPDETAALAARLAALDITTIPLQDITVMASDVEKEFHGVLNGFLSKIGQFEDPQIFKLMRRLGDEIDASKLDQVADHIIDGKPGLLEKTRELFSTAKGRQKLADDAWDETRILITGKTKSLTDMVNAMAAELATEQQKLEGEISSFEQLRTAYRTQFRNFAVATALLAMFLEIARKQVADKEASANVNDLGQKLEIDEWHDKLQALESRALALEGTMTRLPADQMVIRDLENAGIATLQETTTTASARFASIKMTLLALHGALVTKGVQRVAGQAAALDKNLAAIRSRVTKEVVTTAANAPGDNRVAQAQQIKKIVMDSREVRAIVDKAHVDNASKFETARNILEESRKAMLGLDQPAAQAPQGK